MNIITPRRWPPSYFKLKDGSFDNYKEVKREIPLILLYYFLFTYYQ